MHALLEELEIRRERLAADEIKVFDAAVRATLEVRTNHF
jgi:hypothetical protein